MANLCFKHACMGAGKTADLLITDYNYRERGKKVLLLTSGLDTRYKKGEITSRAGLAPRKASVVNELDDIYKLFADRISNAGINIVLVDEAMFLTKAQVWQLAKIVDSLGVQITCFGLRNDFQGNSFEGSDALMAIADKIEEIETICPCGEKAVINARLVDGNIVYEGQKIQIGGNESYAALCRKCWREGCNL